VRRGEGRPDSIANNPEHLRLENLSAFQGYTKAQLFKKIQGFINYAGGEEIVDYEFFINLT